MGEHELDRQTLLRRRPEERGVEHFSEELRVVRAELAEVQHGYGIANLVQRFSSIRRTGQSVAVPPKSIAPAAKTFAPWGVS